MIPVYYKPVVKISRFLKVKKIDYKVFTIKDGGAFHYPDAEINMHIYYLLTEVESFKNVYEPLSFFNKLYELLELILKNADQPETVRIYLRHMIKEQNIKNYFLVGCLHYLLCKLNNSEWMLPPYENTEFNSGKSKNIEDIAMYLDDEITDIYDSMVTDIDYKGGLYKFLPNEFELIYGEKADPESALFSPKIGVTVKEIKVPEVQAKSEKLYGTLKQYGFFSLPEVKNLSDTGKKDLVQLISSGSMPYKIAMMDVINFIQYLDKEFFDTKKKRDQEIMNWFKPGKDPREVRGNINSLTQPNKRYTSYLNKSKAQSDLKSLK